MTDLQEKYADKIAKLLAKAESTTPAEAELLLEKAQSLMSQYAVEQAMIDAARGIQRDEIVTRVLYFIGNQRDELAQMCSYVSGLYNCMIVQWKHATYRDENARKAVKVYTNRCTGETTTEVTNRRKAIKYEITGYESDLDRLLMLETSLRIQAMRAMQQWWEAEGKLHHDHDTYAHKVRIKCEFVESFSNGVYDKLFEAHKSGQKIAKRAEAKKGNDEASVELVLRSRKDNVRDFYDKRYGKLKSGRSSSKTYHSGSAHSAGYAAGQRADVGQSGLKQSKGALGR